MTLRRPALTLAALTGLALGACSQPKPVKQTGTAQGEILESSVSDAMLPLDTVRSQAPLAAVTDVPEKGVKAVKAPVAPESAQSAASDAPEVNAEPVPDAEAT